jgi:outer membrane protein OmpA-like peptidoglycan-associated protein
MLRGVSEDRIRSIGRGETDFIASNADREGRKLNRRIEVEFEY